MSLVEHPACHQALRRPTPCSTTSRSTSSRARSSPSSAARARARARCCAASTGWSRSRPADRRRRRRRSTIRKTDLRKLRQQVGIVFQSYNLFPHLSVEQNITLAPDVVKKHAARRGARARARACCAGSGSRRRSTPIPTSSPAASSSASRSPARSPCSRKLMLFDEITSALDPELTGEVLKVLEAMAQRAA